VYGPGCGLDQLHLSWGHDEYMYLVARDYLPEEGLAMIRYHSCYPVHREGAYAGYLTDRDQEMLRWVRDFNQYDLYSKSHERPDTAALRPYYEELIAEFFPPTVRW